MFPIEYSSYVNDYANKAVNAQKKQDKEDKKFCKYLVEELKKVSDSQLVYNPIPTDVAKVILSYSMDNKNSELIIHSFFNKPSNKIENKIQALLSKLKNCL